MGHEPLDATGDAVTASGIEYAYGRAEALRGVDFTVPSGALYALLGPNGSGKTTLRQVLAGIRRASHGGARVLGRDCGALRYRDRQDIGYIAEGQRLCSSTGRLCRCPLAQPAAPWLRRHRGQAALWRAAAARAGTDRAGGRVRGADALIRALGAAAVRPVLWRAAAGRHPARVPNPGAEDVRHGRRRPHHRFQRRYARTQREWHMAVRDDALDRDWLSRQSGAASASPACSGSIRVRPSRPPDGFCPLLAPRCCSPRTRPLTVRLTVRRRPVASLA
jgi:energy-coupling factor transporter ATP-binding protein EcfA2